MPEAAWKRVERQVATILGGQRIPVTGRHGPGADPGDVAGTPFYVEVRARARCDLWVWWNLTRADAYESNRPPLLVVKQPGRGGQIVAILRVQDLARMLGYCERDLWATPAPPARAPQTEEV